MSVPLQLRNTLSQNTLKNNSKHLTCFYFTICSFLHLRGWRLCCEIRTELLFSPAQKKILQSYRPESPYITCLSRSLECGKPVLTAGADINCEVKVRQICTELFETIFHFFFATSKALAYLATPSFCVHSV